MLTRLWRSRLRTRTTREQMADRVRIETGRGFFLIRAVATTLLAVLILVLPFDASTMARLIAAASVVAVVPVTVAVDRWVPAHRVDMAINAFTALVIVGITATFPSLWFGGFIVLSALAVGSIPLESRLVSLSHVVVFGSTMGAVAWARGVDLWIVPVTGFLVIAPTIERYYSQWRGHREETDRRYDTLIETAGLFFWEMDPATGRMISITGNTDRSIGFPVDDVMAMDWADLVSDFAQVQSVLETLDDEASNAGMFGVFDLKDRDGHDVPFRHRLRVDANTGYVQGAAMEITELALATRLIRHQAEHDGLTGLITRAVLLSNLTAALEACTEDNQVAVLMVDLNRFKEVNDILGHRVGDQLLAVLARRFEQIDSVHCVSRLGGDEFAFVCVDEHARNAAGVAAELVTVIEELIQIDNMKLSISASIGVAVAPADGTTTDQLMMRADTAMYRAKNANERIVQFAESHDARVGEQVALSAELHQAIISGQIEVWFQPKIDLATERIVGAEGLARWRHPDLGLLTPDRFLPLLAVSGEYQAFTDEVIHQAVRFASAMIDDGAPIGIAVNLSAMSFFDHGLADRISALLDTYRVPAELLTLEITESDILEDLSIHMPVFERLTSLGLELAIDDFGVGYSSLSRLRRLPVHELKIDRSFVMGMVNDPEDLIIVKAVVDLAGVLGHRSVAEGVETKEAWDRLREMGCDVAQGYYFGRPMEGAVFAERFTSVDGVRLFNKEFDYR